MSMFSPFGRKFLSNLTKHDIDIWFHSSLQACSIKRSLMLDLPHRIALVLPSMLWKSSHGSMWKSELQTTWRRIILNHNINSNYNLKTKTSRARDETSQCSIFMGSKLFVFIELENFRWRQRKSETSTAK